MTTTLTFQTFLASALILSSGYAVNWFVHTLKRNARRFMQSENIKHRKDPMLIERVDGKVEENIRSFFEQRHPEYEIVFPVESFQDPLIQRIKSLMLSYPESNTQLITDKTETGKSYCWLRYIN